MFYCLLIDRYQAYHGMTVFFFAFMANFMLRRKIKDLILSVAMYAILWYYLQIKVLFLFEYICLYAFIRSWLSKWISYVCIQCAI